MKSRREKNQRKRLGTLRKQRASRIQKLIDAGAIHSEDEIPKNAIPADLSCQTGGTWGFKGRLYYVDLEFTCKSCRKIEAWKAEDQQWYYEIAKGPKQNEATHCHDCRVAKKANQPVK